MAKQRKVRKAPASSGFVASWSRAKREQYRMMADQIKDDVLFPVRLKGSRKAPIGTKDYKKVEEYYGVLFGTKHAPGLAQGVRAAVSFTPEAEMATLRRLYKKQRKVKKISAATDAKIFKQAQEIARAKTVKLMQEIGQERTDVRHAYVDTMIKPRSNETFPVKVTHRDDAPDIIEINHIARESYHFDKMTLALDTAGEIRTAFTELGGTRNSRYAIEVGDGRFIEGELTPELLEKSVNKLMGKYNVDNGHHWEEWLTGVTKLTPTGQKSLKDMRKSFREHYAMKEAYKKAQRKKRKGLPKI